MTNCIAHLQANYVQQLQELSESPLLDCQVIMANAIGKNREWLYSHADEMLSDPELDNIKCAMSRRLAGEPVAYITGTKEFWSLDLDVSPDTLIPRPETELLIEIAIERFSDSALNALDLGTGSGAIALGLALEKPLWQIVGMDLSPGALKVARRNGRQVSNATWLQGYWCHAIAPGSIDLIVSNPPYVRSGDSHLQVLSFEPQLALVGGLDGLDCIREIIQGGYECLSPGGSLLMEHGFDQRDQIKALLTHAGYLGIETFNDLQGIPRAIIAQRPSEVTPIE